MRRVGVLCILVVALAAVAAAVASPPRPAGLPRLIPYWAWHVYAWQAAPVASRGLRPTAPRRLPGWYWAWRAWRISLRPTTAPTTASADVYKGLGAWVDIFDTAVLAKPASAVAAMQAHGVATLFLETSNSDQKLDLVRPDSIVALLEAAHAQGIRVVAWYLPTLRSSAVDLRRSLAAIAFRTSTGQAFDSFALDIESSAVEDVALRNVRLLALAAGVRAAVAADYPLGAIVPSPVGMQIHPTYWPGFPWLDLAQDFNAFLPMAYYTYKPRSSAQVYSYTRDVIAQVRAATGDPSVPIHVVGGIASRSTAAAVESFVRAASDCGAAGASLYDFATTTTSGWDALAAFAPAAGSTC